ncbi:hypothetical protein NZD89_26240 [Alicyclobacillus fastidiosus]|uniref:Uncharacterized protein n=1 Tax=Alicyclobacillus fastidiosus TaxID=392011 RepID=A0ABY6ZHS0_9BACL|nr:hypothetical protein [Alicyclobacillus fastidiosus]WAH41669.1 hypothetical protein NZD89_26240 [Alicyclobacillus fastidiosus]GMA63347.1 hypothetical protein GCM10025859_37870 [Alicyclobacillus fastidiosus]
MGMNSGASGSGFFPFIGAMGVDANLKTAHDQYDIYVNDDFVGQKALIAPSESIVDVADYLKRCNLGRFTASLDGDHYIIAAPDDEIAQAIKGQLHAYLRAR